MNISSVNLITPFKNVNSKITNIFFGTRLNNQENDVFIQTFQPVEFTFLDRTHLKSAKEKYEYSFDIQYEAKKIQKSITKKYADLMSDMEYYKKHGFPPKSKKVRRLVFSRDNNALIGIEELEKNSKRIAIIKNGRISEIQEIFKNPKLSEDNLRNVYHFNKYGDLTKSIIGLTPDGFNFDEEYIFSSNSKKLKAYIDNYHNIPEQNRTILTKYEFEDDSLSAYTENILITPDKSLNESVFDSRYLYRRGKVVQMESFWADNEKCLLHKEKVICRNSKILHKDYSIITEEDTPYWYEYFTYFQ